MPHRGDQPRAEDKLSSQAALQQCRDKYHQFLQNISFYPFHKTASHSLSPES